MGTVREPPTTHDTQCAPSEDAAREFAARFGDRAFADATELLTEDGRERVAESYPAEFRDGSLTAEDALERYWWGLYGQHGDFEGIGDVSEDGDVAVEFEFANGRETAAVDVDEGGVAGLSFSPEYEVPDYVDHERFAEREVTIDAEDVSLGGVLAVPEGDGPFPGVVLVHGHGIHDPDGTAGATKILKDLAWGLASDGIASLRYEKRLYEHEVADEDYTLDAVVTDDAVVAASELAAADEVDADAVFVAGHSQGGMCAPRIADRYGDAAGVVMFDPPADPIVDPDDDLTWLRYGMEPDGDLDAEQEAELEARRETFRRIADADIDPDDTVLGMPGAWHLSQHDCDPVATAGDLDAPAFVLKTGRTDEETQSELSESLRQRFEEWRVADLPDGSRTEFYENVGHYFQDGPTPVTPSSIYFGGNVADYVVEDVAEWIRDVVDGESAVRR
ncbi:MULTISPECIES: alpha/beta hydrolase family protein [Halorussus]|uniref:alpha/beta hydrolase family protein n=1 Tax=Halorussus TaxID=1070314 RepID=UPI00209CADA1|nr:alpha/beta fold hydrolase [Halorussus vallis]USZ74918.1 alpha/beta fold hydrolase [Halorussus vallis]